MDQIELNARQDLAAAYRLADYFGFSEGIDNHLSLSLPNQEDKYLLIPSTSFLMSSINSFSVILY